MRLLEAMGSQWVCLACLLCACSGSTPPSALPSSTLGKDQPVTRRARRPDSAAPQPPGPPPRRARLDPPPIDLPRSLPPAADTDGDAEPDAPSPLVEEYLDPERPAVEPTTESEPTPPAEPPGEPG